MVVPRCCFYIDQPANWLALGHCAIIRGWCFAAEGPPIRGICLHLPDRVLRGATGLPRPDVKSSLPAAPDDYTGFEIRGLLPTGRHTLTLEAELADGTWHPFFTQTVDIRKSWRPPLAGRGNLHRPDCLSNAGPPSLSGPGRTARSISHSSSFQRPAIEHCHPLL